MALKPLYALLTARVIGCPIVSMRRGTYYCCFSKISFIKYTDSNYSI